MATIKVEGLDTKVVESLERLATANNRSLEEHLRHILVEAAGEDTDDKWEPFEDVVKKAWEGREPGPQTPAEVLIRRDRDGIDDLGHKTI